jgi:hypothetical protein
MPIHPRWKSPMLMSKSEPWDFARAPQPCEGFLKVLIDEYWDRLWILLVSRGFLPFVGLSKFNLHSFHTHPFFFYFCCTYIWVSYVGARTGTSLAFMGQWIYG